MTTYRKMKKRPAPSVEKLNEIFTPHTFAERIRLLYHYFCPEDVLYTSSFGTRSAFLLHLISRIRPSQPVHFINTTYHFPETIAYKEQLAAEFGLNLIDILPDPTQNRITREEQMWKNDPNLCCTINKVIPLQPIKAAHKVWISGLMAHQTGYRSTLQVFEQQDGIIKFHPLIDIDEGELLYYFSRHQLPRHPLEDKGYGSIGCEHCTAQGNGRSGRWQGSNKTECGLHPGFVKEMQEEKT